MSKKELLIWNIKIKSDTDSMPNINGNVKCEDNFNYLIENKIDVKNDIKDLMAKSENERWVDIKPEEVYIKDEIPNTTHLQKYSDKNVGNDTCIINESASLHPQNQKNDQAYGVDYKTGKKLFVCNACEYKTNHKGHLKSHIKIHTGERPFECHLCEFKSAHKGLLRRHFKTHTGDKPFECNLCEFKTAYKFIIINHMKTHTEEKLFECNLCDYKSFNKKSNLQRHIRTHMGEKPFKCNLCDYKCAQKSNLTSHSRTHTGEKPFQCFLCGNKFNLKNQLISHMKAHTKKSIQVQNVRVENCLQNSAK